MPEQLSYHSIEGYGSVMCLLTVPPNLPLGQLGRTVKTEERVCGLVANVEGETSPRKALDHKNP
jgi:hypothetical protein